MRIRRIVVFWGALLMLIGCGPILGQQFGANPSSIHWRQIKTDSLQIIFPRGLDSTAFRVAETIRAEQRKPLHSLGNRFRVLPVILQNQTTNSNGYVGLGPFRSEFYLMPPMDAKDLGAQDWPVNLAIHEYRHGQQYNNFDVGWSHLFKILFGDNGQALANDVAIPDWFFEGDAVYNETSFSRQGRGRLPGFMNAFPVLEKENRQYSYQELRNGSYKNYIPDRYNLGYLLVAYGYEKYGPDFWPKVTRDAAAFTSWFYPFQQAIKRQTGLSFKAFRKAAFDNYQRQWQRLDWDTAPMLTNSANGDVTDHKYPYYDSAYGLIYLKSGRKRVHSFVQRKNGHEKTLGLAPIARDDYFGYNNGHLVYTLLHTDPRWSYREFSDLEVLDLASGRKTMITRRQRLFTPDIAHHTDRIAASRLGTDSKSALVVMDRTGKVLNVLPAASGHLYNYPKFTTDDSHLVFLDRDARGQMAIRTWQYGYSGDELSQPDSSRNFRSPSTGQIKTLLPMANRILGFPVIKGDSLWVSSVHNGKDEIWCLSLRSLALGSATDTLSTTIVSVASLVRGTSQATPSPQGVIASIFTADGYQLASIGDVADSLHRITRAVADLAADTLTPMYLNPITRAADDQFGHFLLPDVPDLVKNYVGNENSAANLEASKFSVRKYPTLTHPFHFHSLQPMVSDPDYGLDLYGQNILNTVQTSLYYHYNRVEEIPSIGGNLTIGAWYVQPFASLDYSFDRSAANNQGDRFYYNELTSRLGLQLPLTFSSGNWYRGLYLSSAISESRLFWRQKLAGDPLELMRYLYSRVQFSVLQQQAYQQIYPRWGTVLYGEADQGFDQRGGEQWMAKANFYLPGMGATHSFRVGLAYQTRDTSSSYYYNNHFPFSRGYVQISSPQMWKWGLDYDLPLAYPDWGFGSMCYFSRIRANVYYDQSYTFQPGQIRQSYGSVGGAVLADIRIGNQYPFTIGLQYNHLLRTAYPEKNNWTVILPIHIF